MNLGDTIKAMKVDDVPAEDFHKYLADHMHYLYGGDGPPQDAEERTKKVAKIYIEKALRNQKDKIYNMLMKSGHREAAHAVLEMK